MLTDSQFVRNAFPHRPDDANKGTMGTLLSICGSYGMAGAAMLAARGALGTGVGLLKCALPKSIYPIAAANIWESVYLPLPETEEGRIGRESTDRLLREKCGAVLIGCGLTVCEDTKAIVYSFIEKCKVPMVLDADALNCVADNPSILLKAKAPLVITPHPGEFARLTRSTPQDINRKRERAAADFAHRYRVITVLKGAGTVIASPAGEISVNPTGNSGMATGGSGDVLAGMTGGLLAQGADPFAAAAAAVYLHGLAGDLAAESLGKTAMLPTHLIGHIPDALRRCGIN